MPASQLPWEFHPDLSEERLSTVVQLISEARHAVIASFFEGVGDLPWGLGCLAYDRTRFGIIQASQTLHPWLSIVDPSLRLIFKIGQVPVRLYRGLPDSPPKKMLVQSFPELQQLGFAFSDEEVKSLRWRLAIETDAFGEATRAVFVGMNEDGVVCARWTKDIVPVAPDVIHLQTVSRGGGVDLPPPTVSIPGIGDGVERKKS